MDGLTHSHVLPLYTTPTQSLCFGYQLHKAPFSPKKFSLKFFPVCFTSHVYLLSARGWKYFVQNLYHSINITFSYVNHFYGDIVCCCKVLSVTMLSSQAEIQMFEYFLSRFFTAAKDECLPRLGIHQKSETLITSTLLTLRNFHECINLKANKSFVGVLGKFRRGF
jgi:hypothetical protein